MIPRPRDKQTLYRTSGDSPVIDALIEAAEAGKQVLARRSRLALTSRPTSRGPGGSSSMVSRVCCWLKITASFRWSYATSHRLRRYAHIGTGNYNPKTARLYEDIGLLTANPIVTEDIGRLFNHLSGMAQETQYKRLLVAPRYPQRADRPDQPRDRQS